MENFTNTINSTTLMDILTIMFVLILPMTLVGTHLKEYITFLTPIKNKDINQSNIEKEEELFEKITQKDMNILFIMFVFQSVFLSADIITFSLSVIFNMIAVKFLGFCFKRMLVYVKKNI